MSKAENDDRSLESTVKQKDLLEQESRIRLFVVDTYAGALEKYNILKSEAEVKLGLVEPTLAAIRNSSYKLIFVIVSSLSVVFLISGYRSIQQLQDSFEHRFTLEMRKWLSNNTNDSEVKEALGEIRKEAFINSTILEMHRLMNDRIYEEIEEVRIKLPDNKRKWLLDLMLEEETSYSHFRDALVILRASYPLWVLRKIDPEIVDELLTVFHDPKYSNDKRLLVFDILWNMPNLFTYSVQALEGKQHPEEFKKLAFKNVARFDLKRAISYAENKVSKFDPTKDFFNWEYVEYLITNSPKSRVLEDFLNKIVSVNDASNLYMMIEKCLQGKKPSWTDGEARLNLASKATKELVKLQPRWTTDLFADLRLSLTTPKQKNRIVYISKPFAIYKKQKFSNKILKESKDYINFTESIRFFEVRLNGENLTSVHIIPSDKTTFRFLDGSLIGKEDMLDGYGWITIPDPNKLAIDLVWINKSGVELRKRLKSIEGFKESDYKINYFTKRFEQHGIHDFRSSYFDREVWDN